MLSSTIVKNVFVSFLSCYLAILLASYFDLFWFCMTLVIGHSFTRLYSMNFCWRYSLSFVNRNLAAISFGGLHNQAIVSKHNWVIVFYQKYLYGFSQIENLSLTTIQNRIAQIRKKILHSSSILNPKLYTWCQVNLYALAKYFWNFYQHKWLVEEVPYHLHLH